MKYNEVSKEEEKGEGRDNLIGMEESCPFSFLYLFLHFVVAQCDSVV